MQLALVGLLAELLFVPFGGGVGALPLVVLCFPLHLCHHLAEDLLVTFVYTQKLRFTLISFLVFGLKPSPYSLLFVCVLKSNLLFPYLCARILNQIDFTL